LKICCKISVIFIRIAVFAAVKIFAMVFRIMTSCGLVGKYQHCGGTYCLHLPEDRGSYVPPQVKIQLSPHGSWEQYMLLEKRA
jgi:hypothetical protein